MAVLVDTHCHLNFDSFANDREAVMARAAEQGVSKVLNPGIDLATSREALALAEQFPAVYAAVGVHPNSASQLPEDYLAQVRALAQHPKAVAIGEIGLDYYRDYTPPAQQALVFRQQLDLAAALHLPVVIHCREAMADTLEIIREWRAAHPAYCDDSASTNHLGVFHSYSGNAAEAEEILAMGFYIGITGPVTYKQADALREIAASLPLNRLLIETDAPFLTPQPRRGQRNEPAYVRWVAEKIAEVRQMDVAAFATATSQNADLLFSWAQTHAGGQGEITP